MVVAVAVERGKGIEMCEGLLEKLKEEEGSE